MFTEPPGPSSPVTPWRHDLLWLTLIVGLLFAFRLGSHDLANPDDGRYAEIPREMLATGDWVTPHLNGVNYFEKPPLMYWLMAASMQAFGLNEWALGAVPALFALGGVLLTYAATRKIYGREAGLLAAGVLATNLLYFIIAHSLLLDMGVSVLMAATLFCFILGVRETPGARRRWLFYGLYASAALATLTKGLIGVLVTGAVMFLWLLIFNQWKRLRPLHLPTGLLLFFAIAAPWHVLAAMRNETWAHRYFVYEHWERFFSSAASREGPWYYYIGIVLGGLIPWVGFLWPAVREHFRGGWAARAKHPDAWFFAVWAGFIFLFFTKSHSKLPPYILPIFPALAVFIGVWLASVLKDSTAKRLRVPLRVFSFACGLLAVALVVVMLRPALVKLPPAQALPLRAPVLTVAAVLLLGGIIVPSLARVRGAPTAIHGLFVMTAVFFAAVQFISPTDVKPGTRELAEFVRAHAQPGDRVMHYHEFFHDFTFYARRVVDVVAYTGELELPEDAAARASGRFMEEPKFRELWSGRGRIFAVARKRDVKELFADTTFHYHLLGETRDHYLFANQPD